MSKNSLLWGILLVLLLTSVVTHNLYIMLCSFGLLLILNIFLNKNLKSTFRKVSILLLFYSITCVVQLLLAQEGKVLYKFDINIIITQFTVYITEEGLKIGYSNFMRMVNLLLISSLITSQNLIKSKGNKYQNVIKNVIELIPESIVLIKKRLKIKSFVRFILKEIYSK